MKLNVTAAVDIDLDTIARAFCEMDDDEQAQFFVKVAAIARAEFPTFDNQWYFLGGHLRNCECSTDDAREMIEGIHYAMHHSEHR